MSFLLYGSYGYTGNLIARFAKEQGIVPILAGRNADKLKAQASAFDFPYKVFDLSDRKALEAALGEVPVILHCAGPFIHTYDQVSEACLATGTHYLDITGEWQVFGGLARKDEKAKAAGVMLLPGVGFDVVPSDCLAAHLKSRMPEAESLVLAFKSLGGMSHGTATTMVENLGGSGLVRKDGDLVPVAIGADKREIPFDGKPMDAVCIPWGDIVTAWHSTRIPNIKVYMTMPGTQISMMKVIPYLGWLLRSGPVQSFLKSRVKKQPPGPSDEVRARIRSSFWGQVTHKDGRTAVSRLHGPEGYTLTSLAALLIAQKVVDGNFKPGYQTPSMAYGKDLALEIEGVQVVDDEIVA